MLVLKNVSGSMRSGPYIYPAPFIFNFQLYAKLATIINPLIKLSLDLLNYIARFPPPLFSENKWIFLYYNHSNRPKIDPTDLSNKIFVLRSRTIAIIYV